MIVLGDFNARVGNDWHTWKGVIGNQGFDEVNANGFTLLEFCCRNGLCITNTFFKHQPWHKATWMHPRSKGLHMIDFIIIRQRNRNMVHDTRSFHSVDVWSDHFYVGSSIMIPTARVHCHRVVTAPVLQFNVALLFQPLIAAEYHKALNASFSKQHLLSMCDSEKETKSEAMWKSFCAVVSSAAYSSIGVKAKTSLPDWFQDNFLTIQPLLQQKKILFHKIRSLLRNNLPIPTPLSVQYRKVQNNAKRVICKIQNLWWQKRADDINNFRKNGDWKNLFLIWKQLSQKKTVQALSVFDSSGTFLISDPIQIRDRWKNHFDQVFNSVTSSFEDTIKTMIPQQPVVEELASPPTIEEVFQAITQLLKSACCRQRWHTH